MMEIFEIYATCDTILKRKYTIVRLKHTFLELLSTIHKVFSSKSGKLSLSFAMHTYEHAHTTGKSV